MNDHELLKRLQADDEAAFDTLFRTHYAGLVALAERMLRRHAVAEDIVQDVLADVWRRRHQLVLTESFRAYLFRATRNRVLNHVRHEKVADRLALYQPPVPTPPRGPTLAAEREIGAAVRRAVQLLPDRCREVFVLSREHGLRYAEIAAALGISIKTVEAQMGKALRMLRHQLADWLPGGGTSSTSDV